MNIVEIAVKKFKCVDCHYCENNEFKNHPCTFCEDNKSLCQVKCTTEKCKHSKGCHLNKLVKCNELL